VALETLDQYVHEHAVVQRDARLDDLSTLITISRVAGLLGISRSAAYQCPASGDLPVTHLGGRAYMVTAKPRGCWSQSEGHAGRWQSGDYEHRPTRVPVSSSDSADVRNACGLLRAPIASARSRS